jgi:hypothetical protein
MYCFRSQSVGRVAMSGHMTVLVFLCNYEDVQFSIIAICSPKHCLLPTVTYHNYRYSCWYPEAASGRSGRGRGGWLSMVKQCFSIVKLCRSHEILIYTCLYNFIHIYTDIYIYTDIHCMQHDIRLNGT